MPVNGRSSSTEVQSGVDGPQLQEVTRILEQVIADRGILLQLSREQQTAFLRAAGQVAHPGRSAKRQLVRATRDQRRQKQVELRRRDEALLDKTGIRRQTTIRRLGSASPKPIDPELPPTASGDAEQYIAELNEPRNCYICKRDFQRLHFFYDSMCPDCAEFNWEKRNQSADLHGRYALLTGGRVKIGFEAALKLLRAGANLIVTTRFPHDAARRFAALEDSPTWTDRLQIFGLDLRHTPSVEAFAEHLARTLPRLDFILSNACQTVRRPVGFYEHLMDEERKDVGLLPDVVKDVLADYHALVKQNDLPAAGDQASSHNSAELVAGAVVARAIPHAPELSQVALLPEDTLCDQQVFPEGEFDRDLQQVDLRDVNSWRLKLAEVSTVEMLEVQLVNSVAPFILNAKLKSLMLRVPSKDKHIVNVSAMEGVFYRAFKRDTHPHTNMAKAALNMMTRTSALDYIQDGIHMNSVDTGWITDEDPVEITRRKQDQHGFRTPLDTIDAAARICDPIFDGINSGNHVWGKFLKDYQVSNW